MNKFSYFTLIIFFCENNFFQRGEGPSVPLKYGKSREVEGGGFLSEIPSVVEYGYFLELHNNIYVFF